VVSDDGTIFFGLREGRQYRMYRTRERGGEAAEVCPDCGSIADVSPNGAYVIFHTGEPWSAYVLDVRTGEKRLLLGNAGRTYSSRISPDGKWIAFHIDTGGDEMPRRVMVAPFSPGRRIPESEWIPVSDAGESAFDPCWSPNGSLLFFFSSRDGNRCIWARRLKAGSKQPEGQTFAVAHLHTMSPHIRDSLGMRLTAGNGRIIFSAIDLSSTIYRLRLGR
jgi:WD40 repeat protein